MDVASEELPREGSFKRELDKGSFNEEQREESFEREVNEESFVINIAEAGVNPERLEGVTSDGARRHSIAGSLLSIVGNSSAEEEDHYADTLDHPTLPEGRELLPVTAAAADVQKQNVLCVSDEGRSILHGLDGEREDSGVPVCRICYLSNSTSKIINLGCDCKFDLSLAHKTCAKTWFQFRGNWNCEICGNTAKNVEDDPGRAELLARSSMIIIPRNHARHDTTPVARAPVPPQLIIETQDNRGKGCATLCVCLAVSIVLVWFFMR